MECLPANKLEELKSLLNPSSPERFLFSKHFLKAYPTPGGDSRFAFFFTKIRAKDKFKGTRSNFTPWLRVFDHRGKSCWGWGCCNPPPEN